jgi:hypothetical protein
VWLLSPLTEKVLIYAALGATASLVRVLFRKKEAPEIAEPETPESIRARDRCNICGHVRAFHRKRDGETIQECSDCLFTLRGKNVNYTSFHNFESNEESR